jgi:hypothetical protein
MEKKGRPQALNYRDLFMKSVYLNLQIARKTISAFVLCLFCLASITASAHTPHAQEAQVVIQSISPHARTLIVTFVQDHKLKTLLWNRGTQFLRDGKVASENELKTGTQATIYYRSPFFGKPLITKLVW